MGKLISTLSLDLESAKTLVSFAMIKAIEIGALGAIAVVDNGGHLICLERLDGTMAAASNLAIGKAATAVAFMRPGAVLEQTLTSERPAMALLNSATPFPYIPLKGSYPIICNQQMVGAIAVAGAGNGSNDETIASYAIEEFNKH